MRRVFERCERNLRELARLFTCRRVIFFSVCRKGHRFGGPCILEQFPT